MTQKLRALIIIGEVLGSIPQHPHGGSKSSLTPLLNMHMVHYVHANKPSIHTK